MRATLIAAILVLLPAAAHAGGFSVNEQGAAGTARASAVVAGIDDASAVFWNPAALVNLTGLGQIYVGGTLIMPVATYTPADPTLLDSSETNTGPALVPNAYGSYRFSRSMAVGLGISAPYGLAISWPETSPGRGLVRSQKLTAIFVAPSFAMKIPGVPGLSVAAALDVVPASIDLQRDIVFGSTIGTAHLGGSAFGVGGHAGVLYRSPKLPLRVGLTYKAPIDLAFEGDGDFDIDPVYRADLPADGPMSATITLPQSVLAGVSYKPIKSLEIELDVNYVGWSSYDRLEVSLPGGVTSISEKNYEDSVVFRAAAELALGKSLLVRAGYAYDPTPIPPTTLDFTLPDGDRNFVSAGIGYRHKRLMVDLSAAMVLPTEQTTATTPNEPVYKGTYGVKAPIFALDVGYQL